MTVTCLAWGSLVWDWESRDLPIIPPWTNDGPELPLEFARKSESKRITLVIVPGRPTFRTFRAAMNVRCITEAREILRRCENFSLANINRDVGFWTPERNSGHDCVGIIGKWAQENALSAVVWAAISYKWLTTGDRIPTADEVVEYLRGLIDQGEAKRAEEYVRKAPSHIRTAYRARIEEELDWTATDPTTTSQDAE